MLITTRRQSPWTTEHTTIVKDQRRNEANSQKLVPVVGFLAIFPFLSLFLSFFLSIFPLFSLAFSFILFVFVMTGLFCLFELFSSDSFSSLGTCGRCLAGSLFILDRTCVILCHTVPCEGFFFTDIYYGYRIKYDKRDSKKGAQCMGTGFFDLVLKQTYHFFQQEFGGSFVSCCCRTVFVQPAWWIQKTRRRR